LVLAMELVVSLTLITLVSISFAVAFISLASLASMSVAFRMRSAARNAVDFILYFAVTAR